MPHDGAIIFSDLIGGGLIDEPAVVCGARISVSDRIKAPRSGVEGFAGA
jgi:hypothetical protein